MVDRTLGDVPGLDDLLPNSQILPASYTYTEVNPLGEITADPSMLGDFTMGVGTTDPFAYNVGFLDEPQGDGTEGGHVAVHDPMSSSHLPSYDGGGSSGSTYNPSGVDYSSTASVGQWDSEQVANATTIAEVGRKLGASDRDIQVALMAAIVESGLRNVNYGDRDSLGLFQQRDAWGSAQDRTTPAKAAEMFFMGGAAGQQGLLDIPKAERDKRDMGSLAQDVQVSAYPDRYAQHEAEAEALLGNLTGGSTTSGGGKGDPWAKTQIDGHTVDNFTAAALQAAQKAWGGAGVNIMQGSFSTSVAASGSTHAGGGVIDIAPTDGDFVGLMTALRKTGFAAWIRNMPGYGQAGSGAHIHAVLIGDKLLSDQAQTQIQSYLNNDDGLSGSRPDDGPREYINNRFVWGQDTKPKPPSWRDHVTYLAKGFIGTQFKWAGKDPSGVDFDGLLHAVYKDAGVKLPEFTDDIHDYAEPIDVQDLKPGDLVGWTDPQSGLIQYGIYLHNGRLVEPGGPGRVVQVNEIGNNLLNAFGIPIEKLIQQPGGRPLNRPPTGPPAVQHTSPVPGGGTYYSPTPSSVGHVTTPATHSGGPTHSYTEPHAHVTGGSHPDPHGGQMPGTGGLNPDHPHAPMPGEGA